MPHYVGLDVSLAETSICVTDDDGVIVQEAKVATDAKAVAAALRGRHRRYGAVILEAGSISIWLYAGLLRAKLPVICVETRHAHRILKARMNKTDRNDARGLAELARMGIYRPVHVKSPDGQLGRTLLRARETIQRQKLNIDIALGGMVRPYGLRLGKLANRQGATELVRRLGRLAPALKVSVDAMLRGREALREELERLDRAIADVAVADPVCRLLMTAPGVGPMTALLFRTTVDDPDRFTRVRDVGAFLGLTRRMRASGESDPNTRISRWGHTPTRTALVRAAAHYLVKNNKPNQFQPWVRAIAARRGNLPAAVAGARKLAVVLLSMWKSGTEFRLEAPAT